jgi:lipopolysaccharide export system protein LptA
MQIRSCSPYGTLVIVFLVLAASLLGDPIRMISAWAAEPVEKTPSGPVEITADKLVTDNQNRSALFSGNVTAVQGDTKLTADELKILYKSKSSGQSTGTNDIERLEAHGHVRIEFDNRLAVSNQAVYIIEERKLVLEGPGSKVISDQDEITGTKITFYRNDGRMMLEGDEQNRVKAVIHSEQRGLN